MTASILFSHTSQQTGVTACLMVAGLTQLLTPFLTNLWQFLSLELVFGVFCGYVGLVSNSWIMEMWTTDSNPFMQGLHFSFAIGMTFSPLIVAPFLSSDSDLQQRTASRILAPYSMISASILLCGLMFGILRIFVTYKDEKRSIKKMRSQDPLIPADASFGHKHRDVILIIMSSVFVLFSNTVYSNVFSFLSTFLSCIPVPFPYPEAAYAASLLSASTAAARLVAVFLAVKVTARNMLLISFAMIFAGNLLLLFFVSSFPSMVWSAVVLTGSGISCVYPSFLSLLEQRINMTTLVCCIFELSFSSSSIVLPIVMGTWIQSLPLIFVYVNLISLLISVCFFVLILAQNSSHKRTVANLL